MINTQFNVGEILILKDAYFQVTRYEPGRLRLKEIPVEEVMERLRSESNRLNKPTLCKLPE